MPYTPYDVTSAVAEKIKTSNETVRDIVVQRLAQREIDRRADALTKGLDEREKLVKEGYKLKPDVVTYNADRTPLSEGYSKAKLDEKDKLEKKLEKLEKALTAALDNADYSQLFNLNTGDAQSN